REKFSTRFTEISQVVGEAATWATMDKKKLVTADYSKGREVSSHMESVSAATEEQSASSEEIASASESLSTMATEQKQALRQFKF
ncbi:MAG: methyl-accepting chemotaxis protein, partial [Anaerovibrio sp.]|nr:methyl-accepting chemotaxis protein [Anaerovibrio sp.]